MTQTVIFALDHGELPARIYPAPMIRITPAARSSLLCIALAGAFLFVNSAWALDTKAGRVLAEQNCARCHAIGRKGASPNAQATPFRLIHRKYPIDNLEESFAEGTSGNHLGMPDFEFSPREVGDLLAYIKTLGGKKR